MGLISPPKWPSVNPFSHPLGSKIGRKPMVNPSKWVNLKSNFLKFHHRNQAISGIEKARSIKGKQLKNSRNTVSKQLVELLSSQRDNLSRTKISRKAHFSRVTEVVECSQMCWNLHRMQHICSRYATKILICIGHFSVEILGNVLFFV